MPTGKEVVRRGYTVLNAVVGFFLLALLVVAFAPDVASKASDYLASQSSVFVVWWKVEEVR